MSLVGTRPPTVDEWDKYELHHRARLATKPGLADEIEPAEVLEDVRNVVLTLQKKGILL